MERGGVVAGQQPEQPENESNVGLICGGIARDRGERSATAALAISSAGLVGGTLLSFLFFSGMYTQ